MTVPATLSRYTVAGLVVCGLMLMVLVGARPAAAQNTTLTVRVGVAPATDGARFDLSIDGVALAMGVGDGGSTGVQHVLGGTFVVSETPTPGTGVGSYSTSVTCMDGSTEVVAAAPLTSTAVTVPAGHAVVCAFVNTALTPAAAGAVPISAKPILLPPPFIRGSAILRGAEGCTRRGTVTTRVIGRNIDHIVFRRDGRVVKRVHATSLSWRSYTLETVLPQGDRTEHVVLARTYFISGATPRLTVMSHRFSRCGSTAVSG
ncbi:MAG: hypothetical protein ACR2J9_09600 [Gaiellales bacterium]